MPVLVTSNFDDDSINGVGERLHKVGADWIKTLVSMATESTC